MSDEGVATLHDEPPRQRSASGRARDVRVTITGRQAALIAAVYFTAGMLVGGWLL